MKNHIKQIMEQQRINQRALSHKSGVSEQIISAFFNDRRSTRFSTVEVLADALGYELTLTPKSEDRQPTKIEQLAKINGRETIFRKVKEECAELIVAISHFQEWGENGRNTTSDDIFKEIADIEIMCAQLKVELHGTKHVEKFKNEKIKRQLKRFGLKGD